MKSISLSLLLLLTGTVAFAQTDTARVTLKYDSATKTFKVEEPVYYADSAYTDEYDEEFDNNTVDPQATQSAKTYMREDVDVKEFDDKKWKDIVGSVDYEEKVPKRELKKEEKKGDKSSGFHMPAIDSGILKMISFVVVFILFAFILYYVSKNTTLSQSVKKMKPTDATAAVENIEELDTDGLLKEALNGGDLRLAVRIHYLLLLKKLNEAGLIDWKKNKTNRDYLSELYGRNSCYDDVRILTVAYEFVWYGERSVSAESFQRLSGNFESVNRQITRVQPAI